MFKEKLRTFGIYILSTSPLWAPISASSLDYLVSKHIDGYSVKQGVNSTILMKGHGVTSTTMLRDFDNDGDLDEKVMYVHFPRKPIIPIMKELTEEDQQVYDGILAKL